MKIADVARYLVSVTLLMSVAGCPKEHIADVERAADFFVARMLDTTSLDSLANVPYDSTSIDSLAEGWSADDWERFWGRVEEKRAEAAKSTAEAQQDSVRSAADD